MSNCHDRANIHGRSTHCKWFEARSSQGETDSWIHNTKAQADVARFLSMVKYLVRYTENLMRMRKKSNVVFTWVPEHKKEFYELKRKLSSQSLIQLYVLQLPTKILCDASKKNWMPYLNSNTNISGYLLHMFPCNNGDTRKIYALIEKKSPCDTFCLWTLPSIYIWKTRATLNWLQTTCQFIFKSTEQLPWTVTKNQT